MFQHKKMIIQSFGFAVGVALYLFGVSALMANGQKIFGSLSGVWGGAIMLSLMCVSAAIVASLIFAKPILLAISGEKKQAAQHLVATLGWLIVFLIIAFSCVAIFGKNNVPIYY